MGQRSEPFKGEVQQLAGDIQAMTDDLKTEIELWKDSLESNEMEHLPKYEEVSECYDALEAACDAASEIEDAVSNLPDQFKQRQVGYVQDTRKKASSRSYQLDNVRMMVTALRDDAEQIVNVMDAQEDPEDEDLDVRETAQSIVDACDVWEGEADNVSFPGMY